MCYLHMVARRIFLALVTMVDLVWANTYISGYVIHNSVGIVNMLYAARKRFIHDTGLCVFAPQLANIYWHAIDTN